MRRNPKFYEGEWWPRKPISFCPSCRRDSTENKPGKECYCGGIYQALTVPDLGKLQPLDACVCDTCKEFCTRPCYPTATEAGIMMDEGYGDKLMGYTYWDYWNSIYMLIPAKSGMERKDIHDSNSFYITDESRCTFVTDEGLCKIHDICKPLGGRMTDHTAPYPGLDFSIAATWDTALGEKIRRRWEDEYQQVRTRCVSGHWYLRTGDQECPECSPPAKYRRNADIGMRETDREFFNSPTRENWEQANIVRRRIGEESLPWCPTCRDDYMVPNTPASVWVDPDTGEEDHCPHINIQYDYSTDVEPYHCFDCGWNSHVGCPKCSPDLKVHVGSLPH